jgi:AcrR family transcriptional regulator
VLQCVVPELDSRVVDGRLSLIVAGERLFADRGIDEPSLREINRTAQQRNTSALQYHFGDRDTLLKAVLERQGQQVDSRREVLLDEIGSGKTTPRHLAAALVFPLVACMQDSGGGVEYLQIMGEIVARPVRFASVIQDVTLKSMGRWIAEVERFLPPGAAGRPLHRRSAAWRFAHGELASRAREHRRSHHDLFANHLVDLVAALLVAPVSPETRAYLGAAK